MAVGVQPEHEADFIEWMAEYPLTMLGTVNDTEKLSIVDGYDALIELDMDQMVSAWKNTLDMTGGVA